MTFSNSRNRHLAGNGVVHDPFRGRTPSIITPDQVRGMAGPRIITPGDVRPIAPPVGGPSANPSVCGNHPESRLSNGDLRLLERPEVFNLKNVAAEREVPDEVIRRVLRRSIETDPGDLVYVPRLGVIPRPPICQGHLIRSRPKIPRQRDRVEPYVPKWIDKIYLPDCVVRQERPNRDGSLKIRRQNGQTVEPCWDPNPGNRMDFKPTGWPWTAVGKVTMYAPDPNQPGKMMSLGSGTGTLVGPDLVLTAAHNLIGWHRGTDISVLFQPAYWEGHSLMEKLFYGASWVPEQRAPVDQNQYYNAWGTGWAAYLTQEEKNAGPGGGDWPAKNDFAVMKLDIPIGLLAGTFGVMTFESKWEGDDAYLWNFVGYGGGGPDDHGSLSGEHLTTDGFPPGGGYISFNDFDGDYMFYELESRSADVFKGDSGGGFWAWTQVGEDFRPYIVGVLSGYTHEPQLVEIAAGGLAMTDLVKQYS